MMHQQTQQTPVYQFNRVDLFYGSHRALHIKALNIAGGSITGLAGPNGSGKSTLLKLMTFAEQPTHGEILFNGKKEQPFSPGVRFKISLLTQRPYLLKRTVFENTAYGLKIRGTKDNLEAEVAKALAKVGLSFDDFAQRRWHELSGGEAQRVALAARLALRPQVLLLDEPTASVDLESARLIRQASLAARDEWGTTLVIASHDRLWLDEICDSTIQMFKGKAIKPGIHTVLQGPWTDQENGRRSFSLGDGQYFFAVPPLEQEQDAVGLIDNLKIRVEMDKNGTRDSRSNSKFINQLSGIVTQLTLDPKTFKVAMTVKVGDHRFALRVDRTRVAALAIHPGTRVTLNAGSDCLTWL
ncbi:MAG: ATP-binding cassette domain-containing protein [Desulfobacterium sp.]|jgi:tungstate transport system ATP-binding protein|nr:ATP-binding cassette domain-containing protein [Desulfobacterium sp.]